MPVLCQQNINFLKKTLLPSPYLSKKHHPFINTMLSRYFFFQIVNAQPPAVMPILGQKSVYYVNTTKNFMA